MEKFKTKIVEKEKEKEERCSMFWRGMIRLEMC